jgi:hemolysin activation/secretion protein
VTCRRCCAGATAFRSSIADGRFFAWNTRTPTPDPTTLVSVGLGLRWAATLRASPGPVRSQFELYWGVPLKDVTTPGGNLQDLGLHLQLVIGLF